MQKIALISVSDKTGLAELAKELHNSGYKILATSGTAKAIKAAGIEAITSSDFTGFPEILGGRVKTLHPKIFAGILARRNNSEDIKTVKEKNIELIDIVVLNLYPFKETISKPNAALGNAIENIDIGGPTAIRAAAKNFESVAVITSPEQYPELISELKNNKGSTSIEFRKKCAVKAFEYTAFYDSLIQNFLHSKFLKEESFSEKISLAFEKQQDLRYGENPHQKAAFYKQPIVSSGIASAKQLHGKELSYNNILDANSAIELAREFSEPTAVIIKHSNPCGVASDAKLSTAFKKALECDSKSAFGGIIALNRECDSETANQIVSFFNEIVIAPAFEKSALEILKKKENLRILLLPEIENSQKENSLDFRAVKGGVLVQSSDSIVLDEKNLKIVSEKKPSEKELENLLFAWKVAKHAKSNAIVLAKEKATVGVGAGQMSRIDSTEIAIKKSGERHKGSVLASDAFFPFRDNLDLAAKAGITAIIQPGGSLRDKEVIEAANEHKIAMLFTGIRHFKH